MVKCDLQDLQTDVHQLVQFRTAAFIEVSAAHMALVHQIPQETYGVDRFRVTDALEAHHPSSFTIHMFAPLVKLKVRF